MTRVQFAAIAAGFFASNALAQTYDFSMPSDDRWQYPFNFSGGARPTASVFTSLGTGVPSFSNFNDRDGAFIIAWNTGALIPPGAGAGNYAISSIRVTLRSEPGATWIPDATSDEWYTFDFNNDTFINGDGIPRGQPGDTDGESDDSDPGRGIELFGAGFGPFYTAVSWTENSAYVGGTDQANAPRDPFPMVFQDGTTDVLHCEDSISGRHNQNIANPVGRFTPTPWALGIPVNYVPNAQTVPFDVTFDLNLDLSGGRVRQYFQEQLNAGRVIVYVTALTETVMGGTVGGVPSFYNKEGLGLHPEARAPKLTITLAEQIPGDLDSNGCVDLRDLATLLSNFGTGSGAELADGDTDGDGDVDLSDLAALLANYGTGDCP